MGCDILMHVQIKNPENDLWDFIQENVFDDRDYELFTILDGTRGTPGTIPISDPKGFPDDSADKLMPANGYDNDYTTEFGVYLGYAGVSYLTVTELMSYDWSQKKGSFVEEILPHLHGLAQVHGGPDNVRIVFGYTV